MTNGLVSVEWARRAYGVVFDAKGTVDVGETKKVRDAIRQERRRAAGQAAENVPSVEPWIPSSDAVRVSEVVYCERTDGKLQLRCRCGCVLGHADKSPKMHALMSRLPVQAIGPEVNPSSVNGARFELREFYCPACMTRLEVEISRPDDPVLDDFIRVAGLDHTATQLHRASKTQERQSMSYIIAVDSGGTFCDCVAFDGNGTVTRAKSPSTPPNFDQGVLDLVTEVARRIGRPLKDVLSETTLFAHGTTVATNVLITRTGAKTALVTTKGHEDVMLIGRTAQKVAGLSETEIINVARLSKAAPLVPRPRIHGVDERMDHAGRIVVPLDLDRARPILERLKNEGVEAVAISFLWSFLNTQHEKAVKDWIEREIPGLIVSASHELVPLIREYERTATTVMNAYLTPAVSRYLKLMRSRLIEGGLKGAVAVIIPQAA